jgi:hypothetical protein
MSTAVLEPEVLVDPATSTDHHAYTAQLTMLKTTSLATVNTAWELLWDPTDIMGSLYAIGNFYGDHVTNTQTLAATHSAAYLTSLDPANPVPKSEIADFELIGTRPGGYALNSLGAHAVAIFINQLNSSGLTPTAKRAARVDLRAHPVRHVHEPELVDYSELYTRGFVDWVEGKAGDAVDVLKGAGRAVGNAAQAAAGAVEGAAKKAADKAAKAVRSAVNSTRVFLNRIAASEPFRAASHFIHKWVGKNRNSFGGYRWVVTGKTCDRCLAQADAWNQNAELVAGVPSNEEEWKQAVSNLTPDQVAALRRYSGGTRDGARGMNAYLRAMANGEDPRNFLVGTGNVSRTQAAQNPRRLTNAEYQRMLDNIEQMMAAYDQGPSFTGKDGIAWRAVVDPRFYQGAIGDIRTEQGFLSASARPDLLQNYAARYGSHQIQLNIPKGSKYLPGSRELRELVLAPGSRWRIDAVDALGNTTRMTLLGAEKAAKKLVPTWAKWAAGALAGAAAGGAGVALSPLGELSIANWIDVLHTVGAGAIGAGGKAFGRHGINWNSVGRLIQNVFTSGKYSTITEEALGIGHPAYSAIAATGAQAAYVTGANELAGNYFQGKLSRTTEMSKLSGIEGKSNEGVFGLKFADGSEGILKNSGHKPGPQTEDLISRVAHAVGAKTPTALQLPREWDSLSVDEAMARVRMQTGVTGPLEQADRILMSRVIGITGSDWLAAGGDFRALLATDAGKRLGLLDYLTGGLDRNTGNWMVDQNGVVWGIDQEFQWWTRRGMTAFSTPYWQAAALSAEMPMTTMQLRQVYADLADPALRDAFLRTNNLAYYENMQQKLRSLIAIAEQQDRRAVVLAEAAQKVAPVKVKPWSVSEGAQIAADAGITGNAATLFSQTYSKLSATGKDIFQALPRNSILTVQNIVDLASSNPFRQVWGQLNDLQKEAVVHQILSGAQPIQVARVIKNMQPVELEALLSYSPVLPAGGKANLSEIETKAPSGEGPYPIIGHPEDAAGNGWATTLQFNAMTKAEQQAWTTYTSPLGEAVNKYLRVADAQGVDILAGGRPTGWNVRTSIEDPVGFPLNAADQKKVRDAAYEMAKMAQTKRLGDVMTVSHVFTGERRLIARTTQSTTMYRGIIGDAYNAAVGQIVTEPGIFSTSANRFIGEQFGQAAPIAVQIPAGVPYLLGYPGEAELMFLPGTRFQIVSVDANGKPTVVRILP